MRRRSQMILRVTMNLLPSRRLLCRRETNAEEVEDEMCRPSGPASAREGRPSRQLQMGVTGAYVDVRRAQDDMHALHVTELPSD
jgi:hypothetical protein